MANVRTCEKNKEPAKSPRWGISLSEVVHGLRMIVSLSYRERIYEEIRTAYVYEYSIAKADYEKNHAEWKRRERLHMARNEYAEAAIKARNRMLFLESEAMQSGLFIGVSFRDEAA